MKRISDHKERQIPTIRGEAIYADNETKLTSEKQLNLVMLQSSLKLHLNNLPSYQKGQ